MDFIIFVSKNCTFTVVMYLICPHSTLTSSCKIQNFISLISDLKLDFSTRFLSKKLDWFDNWAYTATTPNDPCPEGTILTNDREECFDVYWILKDKMKWTNCSDDCQPEASCCAMEGTWSHVPQCAVNLDSHEREAYHRVFYKSNFVDGGGQGSWSRICKSISSLSSIKY